MANQTATRSQELYHDQPNHGCRVGFFKIDSHGIIGMLDPSTIELDGQERTRSRTSSVCGEINSTPDINSMPPYDDSSIDDDPDGVLDLPEIALFGTGSWEELKSSDLFVPWRVEPVTHEDVKREFEKDFEKLFRETEESAHSSMPGMTEGSSRDTDSICLSERATYSKDNAMDVVVYNNLSFQHEISQDLSAMPKQLDVMDVDMFEDQGGQSRPNPVPSRMDATEFPGIRTEESDQQCRLFPARIDTSRVPWKIRDEELPSAPGSESSDSESVWMSDYSESVPVLEDGHPFLRVKAQVIDEALRHFDAYRKCIKDSDLLHTSVPTDAGEANTSYTTNRTSSSASYPFHSSGGKRPRGGTKSNGEDGKKDNNNGDDGKEPPTKRGRGNKQSAGRGALLACPYAKKDAIKYRPCYSLTLKRTQDVKQHLSRSHQLPIYCGRCKEIFNSENERDAHLMTIAPICEARDIVYEGVTREQKQLLTRRVSPRMAQEDQWFEIFDILFPNHLPKPKSAYLNMELSADLEAFLAMMDSEGPKIISSTLAAHNISYSSISNPEHDLSSFYEIVFGEGLKRITERWIASLALNETAVDNDNIDESVLSRDSHAQPLSDLSGSSSGTLVASRSHSQQPALLANQFGGDVEAIQQATAFISTGEVGRERYDEMVKPLHDETQQSIQATTQIQYAPGEIPAGPLENHISSAQDSMSDFFDSRELLSPGRLFDGDLPVESLDAALDAALDAELNTSTIGKFDYESLASYDD